MKKFYSYFEIRSLELLPFTLFVLCSSASCNIVCNSGFDGYNFAGFTAVNSPSNYSCWYQINGGVYQVKNFLNIGTVCELVSTVNYTLCQRLNLQPFEEYQLVFDSYNSFEINYSLVGVKLSNMPIYQIEIFGKQFGRKGNVNFTAQNYSEQLCFKPLSYTKIIAGQPGPCIDNVTVIKINYVVSILCPIPTSQNYQQIKFVCKYNDSRARKYLEEISDSQYFDIHIQDELQKGYQVNIMNDEEIVIILHPKRTYSLKNVSFSVRPNITYSVNCFCKKFQVYFQVDSPSMIFSVLSHSQSENLQNFTDFSLKILTIQKNIYQLLRLTFLSYFLLNIFSFWNLSLMYNFLRISTVPHFCKFIIDKLIEILYTLSSIMNWLKDSVLVLQNIDFSKTEGKELIEQYYTNEPWLGHFGISSGFMTNNLEAIFILAGVTVKLFGIMLFNHFIPCKIPILSSIIPKNKRLLKIFLLEILGFQIFMTLSSGTCLMNYGFETWNGLLNNSVQVIIFWSAIVTLPLYFFSEVEERKKKWRTQLKKKTKKQENKEKRINKLKKLLFQFNIKVIKTSFNNVAQYFNFLTIPTFIIFKNDAVFLSINSFVILVRSWCFIKHRKQLLYSFRQKVFAGLNILIWLVYHSIYVAFWVIEQILENKNITEAYESNQALKTFTIVGGYSILVIVLGGGCVEMIEFILSFSFALYKKIKKVSKIIKINNISPNPIQHQIKNEKQLKKYSQIHLQKNKRPINCENYESKKEQGVIKITMIFKKNRKEKKSRPNKKLRT